jgi:hypothetical protein
MLTRRSFRAVPQEGCPRAFFSSGDLKAHTFTHAAEKAFPCGVCGRRLSSRTALRGHVKALHELARPHACTHAGCSATYMTACVPARALRA